MIHVSEMPCVLSHLGECSGGYGVQVHHLLRPYVGHRGTGLRASDKNVIPLCFHHHSELHKRGDEMAYFDYKVGYREFGQDTAKRIWYASPYHEQDDEDDDKFLPIVFDCLNDKCKTQIPLYNMGWTSINCPDCKRLIRNTYQ